MVGATDVAALRGIVGRIAQQVGQSATHETLDEALMQLGLPASISGDTKAKRVESSVAAMPDDQVPDVARRVLDGYHQWLDTTTRNQLQDLLWAGQPHPAIPKRARREVARALAWDDLLNHYQRFRALLEALFVLDDIGFDALFTGRDNSLGARIDQHVHRNPDWTVEETFDALGAIDASDRRFARLLEGIVSGETVPDESAQRRLVAAINPPLAAAGLELRETGAADGYPVFELVASRSRTGRPKNLIFASPIKPDLRLSDAINNDIEIVSNAEHVLVYDRPIGADGIRWRDLQEWWKATRRLELAQVRARVIDHELASGLEEVPQHRDVTTAVEEQQPVARLRDPEDVRVDADVAVVPVRSHVRPGVLVSVDHPRQDPQVGVTNLGYSAVNS